MELRYILVIAGDHGPVLLLSVLLTDRDNERVCLVFRQESGVTIRKKKSPKQTKLH